MSQELTPEQIKHILQGIAIPPQPQVMVDLQMEQCSPTCTAESIAALISQDVGLSGAILKTVNSPYFKLTNKITSITQAVGLLGINSVVNLVNAQSIKGALSDEEIIALGSFWDTAMEVAMTAAVVAKQVGYNSPDEAYTLGLFHNCGIPLLSNKFSNYATVIQEAYHRKDTCITDTENELIYTNHAVVGYYVAKSWNLPPYICEAIHEHHHVTQQFLDNPRSGQLKTLLAILKMSEHISGLHKTLGGCDLDYEWQHVKEAILIYIGLSDYDYEGLIEHIKELGLGVPS
ncbi:MAG TPA: HDOD domain-containing protein [Marinagarivorans sp.]